MFDQISFLQQIGLSVLVVATVVWAVGLVRMLRRDRFEVTVWREGQSLYAMPRQTSHPVETVELSAAERDAFATLVRQLTDGRP
ncbi:hypothetical protein ACFQVC_18550 [Streptomyces monticola]|uniref:Uncharacterized protein n=1 Tax=Streptomyces monticola TaxID=2666263 RepID=A0ABW2JKR0_9ACTN